MIEKETRPRTGTFEVIVARICDMCGLKVPGPDWAHVNSYDVKETTVLMRTGYNCPDGGSGTKTNIDLCPECFEKKLIPWLQSQGVQIRPEEWDW